MYIKEGNDVIGHDIAHISPTHPPTCFLFGSNVPSHALLFSPLPASINTSLFPDWHAFQTMSLSLFSSLHIIPLCFDSITAGPLGIPASSPLHHSLHSSSLFFLLSKSRSLLPPPAVRNIAMLCGLPFDFPLFGSNSSCSAS